MPRREVSEIPWCTREWACVMFHMVSPKSQLPIRVLLVTGVDLFAKKGFVPIPIHPNGLLIPGNVLGEGVRGLEFKKKSRLRL